MTIPRHLPPLSFGMFSVVVGRLRCCCRILSLLRINSDGREERCGCAVAVGLDISDTVSPENSPTKVCGSLLVELSWLKHSRCRLFRAAAGGLAISDRESPDSGPTKVCGLLLVELSWLEPSRCILLI
jgi:hypothetical protein